MSEQPALAALDGVAHRVVPADMIHGTGIPRIARPPGIPVPWITRDWVPWLTRDWVPWITREWQP